jgi:Tfp pilus assembly protein PilV
MRFSTATKYKFTKSPNQGGQALIELIITVTFFLTILLALEKMITSYKYQNGQKPRMTYDVSR